MMLLLMQFLLVAKKMLSLSP